MCVYMFIKESIHQKTVCFVFLYSFLLSKTIMRAHSEDLDNHLSLHLPFLNFPSS